MKKIAVVLMGLLVMTSCNQESETLNEVLKNQRISLTHDIDSFNKIKQQYVYTIDSLKALQNYIVSHQESRERNDRLINERCMIEREITSNTNTNRNLINQNNELKQQISSNKFAIDASKNVYIISVRVHQTTYTLSISEHIKNKINDVIFEIPVDKAYYDKCYVGQKVTDPGFKWGSLLRDGDFSKLKITINGKRTVKR